MILNILLTGEITWRTYLQDANQIAQIIGTILVVIYVVYTYLTFRQIKKQTDYQQDAYLKTDLTILKEINEITSFQIQTGKAITPKNNLINKYINLELSNKMKGILQPIFKFEDNLFEGNYLTLIFINYGNAEVNKICLKLIVTVHNSKELIDQKMLREKETQTIEVLINEIVERNGGKLRIPILTTASFPFFFVQVKGEYYDVRNKKYTITEENFNGENLHLQKLQ
ncbi:hypothetical protein [Flavobacterium algoritolerans]|uniref:Uncharacterized protein n=1 Tax=Flavobacterium algoritolerans TaxID=3041254 RepID=A0ABT6V8Y7_9FLAO|nr:hypothetical protein [Flavobacterium algoritolerans]MDI5894356.1 hypothetical protein [Flavobacterium algoritolerans]